MKTKIALAEAQKISAEIIELLASYCERIEVAGSVRRKKAEVGDLEIVCIPRRLLNLFGEPGDSVLDHRLIELVQSGHLLPAGANGDKYKKFIVHPSGIQLDLFITTPEQWGVIFTIRTGSADFSHRLVTQRFKGGLLPGDLRVGEGRVWRGLEALNTPEEIDFFNVIELRYIKPEARS